MSGYIGPAPVPQATQTREAFTATSGQTTFNTGGYTAGFIDVFMNGVKLAAADYTATNGSDVVLAVGAAADDILETVAYSAFTVADQDFTGETTAEDLTVTGAFTSQGIDDNATSTAMTLDSSGNLLVGTTDNQPFNNTSGTGFVVAHDGYFSVTRNGAVAYFNRNTSDGDITEFRKDGSTVGSIGTLFGDLYVATGNTGIRCVDANRSVSPYDSDAGALVDAAVDLGYASARYKDLYLSGGVYLGGTGSSNKLDDYEEGTWTPTITSGGLSVSTNYSSTYAKVGRLVHVSTYFIVSGTGTADIFKIGGLPFTSISDGYSPNIIDIGKGGKAGAYCRVGTNTTEMEVLYSGDSPTVSRVNMAGNQIASDGPYIILQATYHTNA